MIQFLSLFLHETFHLTIKILPFFILGIIFGAFLESTVKFNFIYKYLNQGRRSILYGTILGGILPGCACATIPMAEGLRRKGAKMATIGAFMLTSPLLAPQTVILTYGFLGLKFTVARIIFSISGGIIIGLIFFGLNNRKLISMPDDINNDKKEGCCSSANHCNIKPNESPSFGVSFVSITKKLSLYFIIGILIASLLTIAIPVELIPNTIGQHPFLAYLLATLIGIPVYVCEGEEIPISYSLLALGLGNGPVLTFLLGAVGTCIPTLLFAKQLLGKKALIIYFVFWAGFAPLSGYIFSLF